MPCVLRCRRRARCGGVGAWGPVDAYCWRHGQPGSGAGFSSLSSRWRLLLRVCFPLLTLPPPPARSPLPCSHHKPMQGGHTTVVIDVNWRPVFWDDEAAAKATVLEYIKQAHILKVTDEVRGGLARCRVPVRCPEVRAVAAVR